MTESVAKAIRTETGVRLVLLVDHTGFVQLSSCEGCADTVPEVVDILTKVAQDISLGAGEDSPHEYRDEDGQWHE
jgi:hypothetical protein